MKSTIHEYFLAEIALILLFSILLINISLMLELKKYSLMLDVNERVITIPGEILFDTGRAQLKRGARRELVKVVQQIKEVTGGGEDWQIRIEGHTDDVPISNKRYESNWELSTARALSIVKFFLGNGYFSADQLHAMGYGEYKPLVPNTSPASQAKNRRVEIKLTQDVQFPIANEGHSGASILRR